VLTVQGVTKRFGTRVVLNDVSLALGPGEFVAITGESGVGKSTLLNVIAGLEPVDAGRVRFGDAEITAMDDDALALLRRRHFGFVFQAFHVLPHLTVVENAGAISASCSRLFMSCRTLLWSRTSLYRFC
jgi:putative ABC transport system ATP-binding protein